MAPDLPEKLLGIDLGDEGDRPSDRSGDRANEDVELERFVFFFVGEHRLALPVDAVKTITAPPDELTRVPRAADAIEGVTDLRGEITVVIDLRTYFPATEDARGAGRLLVFDRPSDEQAAAIRVDDVRGVDAVPKPNVLDESAVGERPVSDDPLEHPLVEAILERERKREPEFGIGSGGLATEIVDVDPETDPGVDSETSGGSRTKPTAAEDDIVVEPFDATDETDPEPAVEADEIVIEATPLVDVEKVLLASGHLE